MKGPSAHLFRTQAHLSWGVRKGIFPAKSGGDDNRAWWRKPRMSPRVPCPDREMTPPGPVAAECRRLKRSSPGAYGPMPIGLKAYSSDVDLISGCAREKGLKGRLNNPRWPPMAPIARSGGLSRKPHDV